MKALIYDGPEKLGYRDAADPVPEAGQQLIKVLSVGICGSDMHAYLGHDDRRPAPLILGHEAAGEIVGGPRAGERVTINPLVGCGTCKACQTGHDNLCPERKIISMPPREGAFAQYVAMRDENLVTVPQGTSLNAAALAEPIACGWHAVKLAKRALDGAAANALVIGGGAIGLGAALSLTAQGVPNVTIVEPNALRREVLNGQCGQNAVAPDDLPNDALFDLVIDGVGYAATRATASAHARPGGVIGHIGLGEGTGGLDVRRMTLQEITFIGTYTYTAQDFRDTAAAIFDGRLGPLDWTEQRPLAEGATAFADIRAGLTAAPKIILNPHA
ncbi:zinc-dependent alcohol dehydrogenase [Yoonia sediminilitoris]|uniref:Threonine dehydrogenase-like Zn-dependent dehydrogenase n=1 Tax=Yoonia sediminilitoris TaxID=1286148 RepID=A0A2T6KHE9_9RHOB|nr:alcohol dehydrogenase catalytic domain-containing protein [Yoonia sediminilitoris]PUB14944.1 threonine dehydrogenase-like Zn-dependent dehydrogenase [Yoonia sediminilitoris]RCW95660.1 threonine dehydrogenase-like Zn-dependent dehydrogenase [Yoonia sediminilitoris]